MKTPENPMIHILGQVFDDSMAEVIYRIRPVGAFATKEAAIAEVEVLNREWKKSYPLYFSEKDPFVTPSMVHPFYGFGTIKNHHDTNHFLIYPMEVR